MEATRRATAAASPYPDTLIRSVRSTMPWRKQAFDILLAMSNKHHQHLTISQSSGQDLNVSPSEMPPAPTPKDEGLNFGPRHERTLRNSE